MPPKCSQCGKYYWTENPCACKSEEPQQPGERTYPELLSDDEKKTLLEKAEVLWEALEENKLGGLSGINRPFLILNEFKEIIEQYGKRDVGLKWSHNDLQKAKASVRKISEPSFQEWGEGFIERQKTRESSWHPIKTAPKDGSEFLSARKVKGKWCYEVCRCFQGRFITDLGTPTHWQMINQIEVEEPKAGAV